MRSLAHVLQVSPGSDELVPPLPGVSLDSVDVPGHYGLGDFEGGDEVFMHVPVDGASNSNDEGLDWHNVPAFLGQGLHQLQMLPLFAGELFCVSGVRAIPYFIDAEGDLSLVMLGVGVCQKCMVLVEFLVAFNNENVWSQLVSLLLCQLGQKPGWEPVVAGLDGGVNF